MRPEISLDSAIVRDNLEAWRARAGVPLRAVIKADGYGWGFETMVAAIDAVVDGYYVGDVDEFEHVRPLTARPIATLVDVPASRVRHVLALAGIPTISSAAGVREADAWARAMGTRARVRVALGTAVGWSGIAAEDVGGFAALLAEHHVDVELSSHITDASLQIEQSEAFDAALITFRNAGAAVVATDLASSMPLAGEAAAHAQVRVGVGLFGARFGAPIDVACAIGVRAPVVDVTRACGQRVGYGLERAPHEGYLVVARVGYGDGFPRSYGLHGIRAVGMQFTTLHARERVTESVLDLIDRDTDLDALAASARTSVHEVVVGLGRTYRLRRA